MADITKCEGKDCPLKESCYRYTAIDSEYRQAYFTESPYSVLNKKCDEYMELNKII
jgi:hypothetical protein